MLWYHLNIATRRPALQQRRKANAVCLNETHSIQPKRMNPAQPVSAEPAEEIDLGVIFFDGALVDIKEIDISELTLVGQLLLVNSSYRFQRSIGIKCDASEYALVHTIRAESLPAAGGFRLFATVDEAMRIAAVYEKFLGDVFHVDCACPSVRAEIQQRRMVPVVGMDG
jgi:hypothetical protein